MITFVALKKHLTGGSVAAWVFWIVLLALALRVLALFHIDPVAFDSAVYFEMAELMRAGRWTDALAYPFPPLFPALIAGSQWLGASAEIAGLLIALATNLLVLLPLFAIARAATGPAALGAVFLWAIHPYAVRLAVRALTDAPTALFVALALWAGLRALQTSRVTWALGAGAASGLAYLTRPEGVEPALALAVLYTFCGREATGRCDGEPSTPPPPSKLAPRMVRRVGWVMAPLVGWAIVASPYVTHISVEAGSLTFSKKKSLAVMWRSLGLGTPRSKPAPESKRESSTSAPTYFTLDRQAKPDWQGQDGTRAIRYREITAAGSLTSRSEDSASGQRAHAVQGRPQAWLLRISRSLYIFQQPLVNGIHPLFLFLGLLGAWRIWFHNVTGSGQARVLLTGSMGLHLIVLLGLAAATGPAYLGWHHVFLMVLYILPFSGVGLSRTLAWIRERIPVLPWAPALVVTVMVASTIPKFTLRPPDPESVIRPAAAWIRQQAYEHPIVVTNVEKLTYHARADRVALRGNYDELIALARTRRAHFVAFYPNAVDALSPDLRARLDSGDLELAAEFSKRSRGNVHHFQIYRLRPEPVTTDPMTR